MPDATDCHCGRSQNLSSYLDGKIVIDQKTFKRLRSLIHECDDTLSNPRNCEIFLTSLDTYLSDTAKPEVTKCLLLLNYYRDIVPEALTDIAGWLEEARDLMGVILAASELGGGNE
jgi:hypothetical protein